MRIGLGYDVHALVADRPLILGGVTIPHSKGLLGHSDADVLTHTIMDAILGALNLGTIGDLFPDTDAAYKDASSLGLLEVVIAKMQERKMHIVNVDSVIAAQVPKLAPFMTEIRATLAPILGVGEDCVSVKATTTERLGFEGREEGISAQAVVLLAADD